MIQNFVRCSVSNYISLRFCFVVFGEKFIFFLQHLKWGKNYQCQTGHPLHSSSNTCTVALRKLHVKSWPSVWLQIAPIAASIKVFFYAQNANIVSTSRESPPQLFVCVWESERWRGEYSMSTAWFPQRFVGTRLQRCEGWPEAASLKSSLCRRVCRFNRSQTENLRRINYSAPDG